MIVSIGEPMIEFNQIEARHFLQGFGGDSSNMIIAAARSGAQTAYFTRVGDDEFGRMLLELWQREGVETSAVIIDREAPTAAYFVTHGPKGHAFSYLRAGSAASRMRPADLPKEMIENAKYVHASGISIAIACGKLRPERRSNSAALSNIAESLPPGVSMGKSFGRSSPNNSEASTFCRAYIQLTLPRRVLISPL